MTIAKVPQLLWEGPSDLELTFPDTWSVEVCKFAGYDRPAMSDEQIKAAIGKPLAGPPIRELARGKKEVVITFDDVARPTRVSKIVPHVLEELARAGISDRQIRFVCASGTHGALTRRDFAHKLGESVLGRFPVYNHNCHEHCTYVGTTPAGTKVFLNSEVMSCDFKIAIGLVCPHVAVRFGGGGKMVIPGIAHIDTVFHNHSLPATPEEKVNYDLNPIRLDMEEAAKLAGFDVDIECLVNGWGDTTDIFWGPEELAHPATVEQAKAHYLTPKAVDKDIVIANTYAKAVESAIGMNATVSVSEKGGDFVLIANTPDGQVVHYLSGQWGTEIRGRNPIVAPIPPKVNRLFVYSEYPDYMGTMSFLGGSPKIVMADRWSDVLKSLREAHGDNASVAVYPSADIHYFGG